jgi:hypothetical protein
MKRVTSNELRVLTLALVLAVMLTACGRGAVDGHDVGNINLTYADSGANLITFVDFDITPGAESAEVSLTNDGETFACELTDGGCHAHCAVSIPVAMFDSFKVIVK